MGKVIWPFGKADTPAALTTAAAVAGHIAILNEQGGASIDNQYTLQKLALTADATIDLILGNELRVGAILELWFSSDGTARTITLGTGFNAAIAIAGVINKTLKVIFTFDGTSFSQAAPKIQIT
jgi:predicted NBD/HSP70 family sugar kinase